MANIINPTRLYKDLDFSFAKHPQRGDVLKKLDVNSINQSLRILLFTMQGERLFQPSVGTPLYKLLFEPLDEVSMTLVDQAIEQTIQNFEPRIDLNLIQVVANDEQNGIDISIFYTIKGTQTPGSFSTTLKRVR